MKATIFDFRTAAQEWWGFTTESTQAGKELYAQFMRDLREIEFSPFDRVIDDEA